MKYQRGFKKIFFPLIIYGFIVAIIFSWLFLRDTLNNSNHIQALAYTERLTQVTHLIDTQFNQMYRIVDTYCTSPQYNNLMQTSIDQSDAHHLHNLNQDVQNLKSLNLPTQVDYSFISLTNRWTYQNKQLLPLSKADYDQYLLHIDAKMNSNPEWTHSTDDIYFLNYLPLKNPIKTSIIRGSIRKESLSDTIQAFDLTNLAILDNRGAPLFNMGLSEVAFTNQIIFADTTPSQPTVIDDIIYQKIPSTNLTIASILPKQSLTHYLNENCLIILSILCATLIGLIFCAYFFALIIFRPIEQLTMIFDNDSHDLTEVYQSIIELKKQNETNEKSLSHYEPVIHQQFVHSLLEGNMINSEVQAYLTHLQLKQSITHCTRFVILISQIEYFEGDDNYFWSFGVSQLISELLPIDCQLKPIIIDGHRQVTILSYNHLNNAEIEATVLQLAETLQANIKFYLKLDVSFGISREFDNLINSQLAFEEAFLALRQHIKSNHPVIILYDNLTLDNTNSSIFSYPKDTELKLIQSVCNGELDHAIINLDVFFNQIQQNFVSIDMFETCVNQLVNELLLLAYESIHSELNDAIIIERENLLKQILDYPKPTFIKPLIIHQLLNPLCEFNLNKTQQEALQISEAVVRLLQKDCGLEITLDWVAKELNYSPNYLSFVFSSQMGITFSDFINKVRIEKCKYLLTNTDLKIHEISEQIGYTQPQNFHRFFRTMVGTTPGKYRKLHKTNAPDIF